MSLIYPPVCGICGKLAPDFLCKRCEMVLKQHAIFNVELVNKIDSNDLYFKELISIFPYEGLIRKSILEYKFQDKAYLFRTFVNFVLKNEKIFEKIKTYDKIIVVPISQERFKQRGYNQCLLMAREMSKRTQVELVKNALVKTKNTTEQSKLNQEQRKFNVQGVYDLKKQSILRNKRILLVDDIYTTGNTVHECCKTLYLACPKQIDVFVLAKD